jgi:predicted nuclease of predicted toxin-antitoxin system
MRTAGCSLTRVQDLGLSGAPDAVVFEKAQDLGAVLVTTDRGFGDVRTYPPSSHQGIIVLKVTPSPEEIQHVHRTLQHLLNTEDRFRKTLFIVDAQKYRKRMSP